MKSRILMPLFFLLAAAVFSEDVGDPPRGPGRFEISGGASFGTMIQGAQLNFLSPRPDEYRYFALQADLKIFLWESFGFELASDFVGITTARYNGYGYNYSYGYGGYGTPIWVSSTSVYSAGAVFRRNFPISEGAVTFSLYAGGGVTYNTFHYGDDAFALVQPGYYLSAITPEPGFYGKLGGALYISRPFFFAADVEYMEIRDKVATTGANFDAGYIKLNGRIGMDF